MEDKIHDIVDVKVTNDAVMKATTNGTARNGLQKTYVKPVTSTSVSTSADVRVLSPGSHRSRKRTSRDYPMIESSTPRKKPTTPVTPAAIETQKKRLRAKEEMNWICCDCKEAEATDDPDAVLLLCEGECNRVFHSSCAGVTEAPEGAWICNDCIRQNHMCCICQEYGADQVDVFGCKVITCGLFFHESCLSTYSVDVQLMPKTSEVTMSTSKDSTNAIAETVPSFKCPAHRCWTCTEEMVVDDQLQETLPMKKGKGKGGKKAKKKDNIFGTKTGSLFRCLECPIAYHIDCIPPFARFHELALLCHDHAATCKLPELDLETSFQIKVEREVDKKIQNLQKSRTGNKKETAKVEGNIFFLGLRGDAVTSDEDKLLSHVEEYLEKHDDQTTPKSLHELTFCLPCDLKNEVHSKPPSFRLVHTLRYNPNNRPKRKDPSGESCQCKNKKLTSCDENCHNRIMFIECVGDSSKSGKNLYWNCDLGPNCGNRSIGLRKAAKCKPEREQGKGWGLISLGHLKKGALVQEYVGEVIDERTKNERLKDWSKDHPNDPNFYIMQLETGWYIDARVEANLSRFVNHSCEPNCVLKPFNVSGYSRVGIFALREISPGEFLSYDYQFDTKHGDKFTCRCGALKCRGTMKGGKQAIDKEEAAKKTSKQVLVEAKAREEKDRRYLEDAHRLLENRFSLVDVMIPAFSYPDELVASGPFDRYKSEGRSNGVFLWRNARIGGEFSNRALLLERRKKVRPLKQGGESAMVDVLAKLASMK